MSNANMSESLIKIFAAIRGQVFDENNGLLSPEYLLLKMVEFSDEFRNILNTNKINIHELQSNLRATVDVNKPRTLSKELKHSATMEKVMQRTIMKILSMGRNELDEIDLLMTISSAPRPSLRRACWETAACGRWRCSARAACCCCAWRACACATPG